MWTHTGNMSKNTKGVEQTLAEDLIERYMDRTFVGLTETLSLLIDQPNIAETAAAAIYLFMTAVNDVGLLRSYTVPGVGKKQGIVFDDLIEMWPDCYIQEALDYIKRADSPCVKIGETLGCALIVYLV
jgi:hypothetical protein